MMKNLMLGIVLGLGLAVALLMALSTPTTRLASPGMSYPYSQFILDLDGGRIAEVTLRGSKIAGSFKDHNVFETLAPHAQVLPALVERLLVNKVIIMTLPTEEDASASSILAAWMPTLMSYGLFFGALWFVMTRPVLALIRQLEAYSKAAQGTAPKPPAPPS